MHWITKQQAAKILKVQPDQVVQYSQRNPHIQVRRKRGVPGNRPGSDGSGFTVMSTSSDGQN